MNSFRAPGASNSGYRRTGGPLPLGRRPPCPIALATRATTWASRRGHQFRVGVFDALYPQLGANFRRPLRELGLMPVHRLRKSALGVQANHEGAVLVEGTWYCEQMPSRLKNASNDRESDAITEEQYSQRLEDRARWQMYPINGDQLVDDTGALIDRRYECPESRRGSDLSCVRGVSGTSPTRAPLPVTPLPQGQTQPKACAQRTVSLPATIGLGYEQAEPYKSPPGTPSTTATVP